MRITLTDEDIGQSVDRIVDPGELDSMSGLQLAALFLPNPTSDDITTINKFLAHYRGRN